MGGLAAFFRVLAQMPASQKRNFIVAEIGVVFIALTQLMIPQLVQQIIDDGITAGDMDAVVRVSLQMIMWATASLLVSGCVAYLAAATATNLSNHVRTELFAKITTLSSGNLDRLTAGSLLVRTTSDINILRNSWMLTMYALFQAPWLLIGAVALVWWQTPSLLWLMALVLVVVTTTVLLIAPALGPMFAKAQRALDRLNVVYQENIAGIRVVKAFDRDALERQRFAERNGQVRDAQLRPAFRVALFQPILFGMIYAAVGAAVFFAGDSVVDFVNTGNPEAISPGELTTFFNYLITAMIPIMIVAFVLPELGRFEASLERALEVLRTEPDVRQPADPIDPGQLTGRIEFRNVSMSYLDEDGQPLPVSVLKDVSFTVEPGQTVAILGQTGSGKSTLINLIPRFYDVTGGAVLVDGHDVRDLDLKALRGQIGFAAQQAFVFAGTFESNLRMGNPDGDAAEMAAAAAVADADEFISAQVDGYQAEVAESGNNLSGGQRQRLSLARAVNSDPRILILDDTTSALDVATEARVQQALAESMGDRTMIFVAQRISTAVGADQIILLEGGTVADRGTHAELFARSQSYREIVASQLGSVEEFLAMQDDEHSGLGSA